MEWLDPIADVNTIEMLWGDLKQAILARRSTSILHLKYF